MKSKINDFNVKIPFFKPNKNKVQIFFDLNYSLFPILWTLTFFLGILESFTYSGYSFAHLFLPFQLLFGLTIFSGIVSRLGPGIVEYEQNNPTSNRTIFTINKLIVIPIIASYLLINSLEAQNYHNYVFSTIHLQPDLYFWPTFLSIYLFFISIQINQGDLLVRRIFLTEKKTFNLQKDGWEILLRVAVFVFAFNIFMKNLPIITPWMYERSKYIVKHPLASYDEKMRYGWGELYDYMLFVRKNTPDDAVVMLPPMLNPWMDIGGEGLIRYFLYPRLTIQDMTNLIAPVDRRADYVVIAWGLGTCTIDEGECHGWPRIKIPAEQIIYKKNNSTDVEKIIYDVTYDFDNDVNKGVWGLIKLKK